MKLRVLVLVLAVLAGLESWAWWHDRARREQSAASGLIDTPLLEVPEIERAQRIVVREKPQSKVVDSTEEGFEVRLIADPNAPIRETVLERREGQRWVVANCLALDADPEWLGQTMRDLTQGRLVRYVTGDPKLMDDLQLNLAQVRFEDAQGKVIRQLDFGRKAGGASYQFVRVNGREAFVAKHEAEILGDPLTWIVNRVLTFKPADVRELALPCLDAPATPVVLRRAAREQPLRPAEPATPAADLIARNAEKILARLLAEPVWQVFAPDAAPVQAARQHIVATLRFGLFDGREYRVSYAMVPAADPAMQSLDANIREDVVFAFFECSDPQDLTQRYQAHAVLGYAKASTIGRLPKNRAALAADDSASAASGASPTP
jgi:hypothetical protein